MIERAPWTFCAIIWISSTRCASPQAVNKVALGAKWQDGPAARARNARNGFGGRSSRDRVRPRAGALTQVPERRARRGTSSNVRRNEARSPLSAVRRHCLLRDGCQARQQADPALGQGGKPNARLRRRGRSFVRAVSGRPSPARRPKRSPCRTTVWRGQTSVVDCYARPRPWLLIQGPTSSRLHPGCSIGSPR